MRDRFPGKTCVLCSKQSVGVGEHVWPSWFIGEFEGQGPFVTSRAGVPYTKRDRKTPAPHTALQGVHVPMCEACNNMLSRTIEEPAKAVVRRILAHGDSASSMVLTADECGALATWLLKVGILGEHPESDFDHPGLQSDPDVPRKSRIPHEWLDWMRQGTTPPSGFSVFVSRRNLRGNDGEARAKQRIILPRLRVDGKELDFSQWAFGLTGLDVTVVWHPGWEILHPRVEEGRAARLWPDPVVTDFGALPETHPHELTFLEESGGILDLSSDDYATFTGEPLSVETDVCEVFLASFHGTEETRNDLKSGQQSRGLSTSVAE